MSTYLQDLAPLLMSGGAALMSNRPFEALSRNLPLGIQMMYQQREARIDREREAEQLRTRRNLAQRMFPVTGLGQQQGGFALTSATGTGFGGPDGTAAGFRGMVMEQGASAMPGILKMQQALNPAPQIIKGADGFQYSVPLGGQPTRLIPEATKDLQVRTGPYGQVVTVDPQSGDTKFRSGGRTPRDTLTRADGSVWSFDERRNSVTPLLEPFTEAERMQMAARPPKPQQATQKDRNSVSVAEGIMGKTAEIARLYADGFDPNQPLSIWLDKVFTAARLGSMNEGQRLDFENAMGGIVDDILFVRSGLAVTESERAAKQRQLIPTTRDGEAQIQQKRRTLWSEIGTMAAPTLLINNPADPAVVKARDVLMEVNRNLIAAGGKARVYEGIPGLRTEDLLAQGVPPDRIQNVSRDAVIAEARRQAEVRQRDSAAQGESSVDPSQPPPIPPLPAPPAIPAPGFERSANTEAVLQRRRVTEAERETGKRSLNRTLERLRREGAID